MFFELGLTPLGSYRRYIIKNIRNFNALFDANVLRHNSPCFISYAEFIVRLLELDKQLTEAEARSWADIDSVKHIFASLEQIILFAIDIYLVMDCDSKAAGYKNALLHNDNLHSLKSYILTQAPLLMPEINSRRSYLAKPEDFRLKTQKNISETTPLKQRKEQAGLSQRIARILRDWKISSAIPYYSRINLEELDRQINYLRQRYASYGELLCDDTTSLGIWRRIKGICERKLESHSPALIDCFFRQAELASRKPALTELHQVATAAIEHLDRLREANAASISQRIEQLSLAGLDDPNKLLNHLQQVLGIHQVASASLSIY